MSLLTSLVGDFDVLGFGQDLYRVKNEVFGVNKKGAVVVVFIYLCYLICIDLINAKVVLFRNSK